MNPTDLRASTDFDADRPVRLHWHGQQVSVFRVTDVFEVDGTAVPQIVLMIGLENRIRRVRPCRADDTRVTVLEAARSWLDATVVEARRPTPPPQQAAQDSPSDSTES